jgi:NADH-quinone oxidoreductase subunit J
MMHWSFYIVAGLTVGSGLAAMSLRNIVHCALLLTITFAGLALLYLQLDAQFVALAQILIYIGAVAILIVFAILLTHGSDIGPKSSRSAMTIGSGVVIALGAFVTITKSILSSGLMRQPETALHVPTVQEIGKGLMADYVVPLELVALLLTAALIGATVIAIQERRRAE